MTFGKVIHISPPNPICLLIRDIFKYKTMYGDHIEIRKQFDNSTTIPHIETKVCNVTLIGSTGVDGCSKLSISKTYPNSIWPPLSEQL